MIRAFFFKRNNVDRGRKFSALTVLDESRHGLEIRSVRRTSASLSITDYSVHIQDITTQILPTSLPFYHIPISYGPWSKS
ncbi:MAG TPA: hypothetical protein DIW47_12205 [Bacteroidetes bacterium]|nr:hypothetical protein [Bacteroidota bacterium]